MTKWYSFVKTLAKIVSFEIPFEKEDKYILSKFNLQGLRASYPETELIPDDISIEVGKAYQHIHRAKRFKGTKYLEESELGKKIQGAINHDRDFIENFCRPVYDTCIEIENDGTDLNLNKKDDQIKVKKQVLDNTKAKDDDLTKVGQVCEERIKRYGIQRHVPKYS